MSNYNDNSNKNADYNHMTSSWRPFGPLDFVLCALQALRSVGRARLRSGDLFRTF